jgi:hypothetical protein
VRSEAEIRAALARVKAQADESRGKPGMGQSYMLGLDMTVQSLLWVLGEPGDGPGRIHPHSLLMEEPYQPGRKPWCA